MSLINQMLQALEQRQDRQPQASSAVRVAAPPTSSGQGRWLWLGGASLLLLAFAAGWLLRREAPPPAAPQALAVPEVKPVAPPVPAANPAPVQPVAEIPPPPTLQPVPLPAPPKAPETPPPAPKPVAETPTPSSSPIADKAPKKQDKPAGAAIPSTGEPAVRPAPTPPKPATSTAKNAAQLKQTTPRQRAEQSYQQAISFQRERRDAEAMDALRRTLQLAPEHAAARQALAMQLTENGEAEAAEALLKEGMQLNPGQPGLSMSLARLMVERGDDAGALELLDQQGNAGRFGADQQTLYAALLQRAGRHADAVERYRLALGANPASAQSWAGLGISLRATGQTDAARESFRRAIQVGGLDPALESFVRESLREMGGERSE